MLFKKKKFPKLTSREVDIMNILWTSGKPLIASEIADCRPDLTINTVQAVLRKLLKYQLVEVADDFLFSFLLGFLGFLTPV